MFVCCLCLNTCRVDAMLVLRFRCCCCCLLSSDVNGCFLIVYMFDFCSYSFSLLSSCRCGPHVVFVVCVKCLGCHDCVAMYVLCLLLAEY